MLTFDIKNISGYLSKDDLEKVHKVLRDQSLKDQVFQAGLPTQAHPPDGFSGRFVNVVCLPTSATSGRAAGGDGVQKEWHEGAEAMS